MNLYCTKQQFWINYCDCLGFINYFFYSVLWQTNATIYVKYCSSAFCLCNVAFIQHINLWSGLGFDCSDFCREENPDIVNQIPPSWRFLQLELNEWVTFQLLRAHRFSIWTEAVRNHVHKYAALINSQDKGRILEENWDFKS